MEGDEDDIGGGDSVVDAPSYSTAPATAMDSENSDMNMESVSDIQQHESVPGNESQMARPGFQYSTDLRKELSLDVLASLGDTSSADDGKSLEDSMMDLAPVSASDMEFISELSPLDLQIDQTDDADPAANSFETSATMTTAVAPSHVSVPPNAPPISNISMSTSSTMPGVSPLTFPLDAPPGGNLSLPLLPALADDSVPSAPVELSHSKNFASTLPAPAETIVDATPSVVGAGFVDDADLVSSIVSSAHSAPATAKKSALVFNDTTSELLQRHTPEDLAELSSSGGLSSFETPRYGHLEGPVYLESSQVSLEGPLSSTTFPSAVGDLASSVAVMPPAPVETQLSFDHSVRPIAENALFSTQGPSTAVSYASTHCVQEPFLSGDNSPSETAFASFEIPMTLDTMTTLSVEDPLLGNTSPRFLDDCRMAVEALPSGASAANVSASGESSVFHVSSSSAFNSISVPPRMNTTDLVDALPSFSSSVLTTLLPACAPDFSPISDAAWPPSLLNVRPDDSGSLPPDPAVRVWDLPSSSGASLSSYFDVTPSPFRGRKSARKKRLSEAGDVKDSKGKGLSETDKTEGVDELEHMLEAQKKMLQWQIDEMQRITALQCQLTSINPLSEELGWEVIGEKGGGKKSGDALSQETLKLLQDIFAVKDTLTKREARDISISSGASLIQVKEYFAGQRSVVRKLVQQAHDEAGRLGIKNASEQSDDIPVLNNISEFEKNLGFDKLAGIESMEKLVDLMWAEKRFAGQAQLLQVILHTDSTALILRRLLERGALKILGGWLIEAAVEEQSTVICHLLKVLDHLPMNNAVPLHMRPLVQNVNKIRFYHISDIAVQARSLITKWSKMFLPKTEGVKSASSPRSKLAADNGASLVTPSRFQKRSRDATALQVAPVSRKKKIRSESGVQYDAKPVVAAAPASPSLNGASQGTPELPPTMQQAAKPRWSSTLQPSESAVAAVSVSRKRYLTLGDQSKDRFKAIGLEDNTANKPVPSGGLKSAKISKNSRPLSTDDIYKAKKLERLMQEPVKSRRRRASEHAQAWDGVSQTGPPKGMSSPELPAHVTTAKKDVVLSQDSDQKNLRRGSLTGSATNQNEFGRPEGTHTPSSIQDFSESMQAATPTSSQEPSTPTSDQDLFLPATMTGDLQDESVHGNGSAPGMDTSVLSSSLGTLNQGHSFNVAHGANTQTSAGRDSPELPSMMADEASNAMLSPDMPSSMVLKGKESMSKLLAVGDVSMLHASSESSRPALDELPPVLSSLSNMASTVHEAATDVSILKGRVLGQELEMDDNASHERTVTDLYAVLRASMIRWRIPPEYQPDAEWNVAAGEDSKENDGQSGRVKREEEAYYSEVSAVPDDPKDPWEEEPNYDDSLTLEIFVEGGQQKVLTGGNDQSDVSKSSSFNMFPPATHVPVHIEAEISGSSKQSTPVNNTQHVTPEQMKKGPNVNGLDLVLQQVSANSGRVHDPDLLALLLRNPELVSQLTAGQGFTPSGANQAVFMQPHNLFKPFSSSGNNGVGISPLVAGLGHERLTAPNNSKAMGNPPQPGRSVSSVDQTPSEMLRVQDSIPMMSHPGMGQQQTMRFVPHGGVDNRFLAPQMPAVAVRNIQDTSAQGQPRVPPPPAMLPMMQSVANQGQQLPLPGQHNKLSNWPQPQDWAGVGRPLPNPPQTYPGQEQLHRPQPIMTNNVRPSNYGGIVGLPLVEVGPVTTSVPQQDIQHGQRAWSNGSHGVPVRENTAMPAGHESVVGRNTRWPRPHMRPPDQHGRAGGREFADVTGRQSNDAENRTAWIQNDRARPVQQQQPIFQGGYGLQPPHPPQHPTLHWQAQHESIVRPSQSGAGPPFSHGRDVRAPQQQVWYNNMAPASKPLWRAP